MPGNLLGSTVKRVGVVLTKNSPTILTALGVAGLISTVSLAISATPKAIKILRTEEIEREIEFNITEPLTNLERVQLTWKCYIPAALVGAATVACIISANSISLRRNAALASLYTLTERAMQEYQAKVIDTIGKNKAEKIKDEIVQDRLNANPVSGNTIILTEKGNTLCYDILSGRYFKSDIDHIKRIQNDFNAELIKGTYRTLNELYDQLGLSDTKTGRDIGWTTDSGMLEIIFDAKIANDQQPCIVLDYRNGPVPII